MNIADFFDYLRGRPSTRDLALQLAYVHDLRECQHPDPRVPAQR